MPKIHHPRILLTLLVVIVLIGGTVAVLASQQDSDGSTVPVPIPTLSPLDGDDRQAVVDIVRQSGIVEDVAGVQAWSASDFYLRPVGQTKGVYFIGTWEQPVDYSGPWLDGDNCQGTRGFEFSSPWTGITQLSISVDLENDAVVHYMPYNVVRPNPYQEAPQRSNPTKVGDLGPEDQIKLYDMESQSLIYEGPRKDTPEECPTGRESD